MMLVLWSFYFLLKERFAFSFVFFLLSIGIKFATGLLAPVYFLYFSMKKKKKINWEKLFLVATFFIGIAVVVATVRTNFQPWYLLYILPFLALFSYKYYCFLSAVILSIGGAFYYVPYILSGNWNEPIPSMLFIYELATLFILFLVVFGYYLLKGRSIKIS